MSPLLEAMRPDASLPAELLRLGPRLVDQQLWSWGYDVRRPEGNLLLEYGFERCRPPAGILGSSRYTCGISGSSAITLWGFGILYGEAGSGSVYLGRSGLRPLLSNCSAAPGDAWAPDEIPGLRIPASTDESGQAWMLARKTCCWVAEYERWVKEFAGNDYRSQCLAAWGRRPMPGGDTATLWSRFGQLCEAHERSEVGRSKGRPLGVPEEC